MVIVLNCFVTAEKCKDLSVLRRRPDLARRQGALWANGCQLLCLGLAGKPHIMEQFSRDLQGKLASYADCKDLSNPQKVRNQHSIGDM